jgi:hypothetical protein
MEFVEGHMKKVEHLSEPTNEKKDVLVQSIVGGHAKVLIDTNQ